MKIIERTHRATSERVWTRRQVVGGNMKGMKRREALAVTGSSYEPKQDSTAKRMC
jgi:hypothetical protein